MIYLIILGGVIAVAGLFGAATSWENEEEWLAVFGVGMLIVILFAFFGFVNYESDQIYIQDHLALQETVSDLMNNRSVLDLERSEIVKNVINSNAWVKKEQGYFNRSWFWAGVTPNEVDDLKPISLKHVK